MAVVEVWANDGTALVTAGPSSSSAPVAGTMETWTLAAGSTLPAVSSSAIPPTQCYIADQNPGAESEKALVTNITGSGPYTATVTRGADGTTPVPHAANCVFQNVVTRASLLVLQAAIPLSAEGTAGGVATLDGSGLVPLAQLPVSSSSLYLAGNGAPSGSLGLNGDYYVDTTVGNLYGPKAGGAWGSVIATFVLGPAGLTAAARCTERTFFS